MQPEKMKKIWLKILAVAGSLVILVFIALLSIGIMQRQADYRRASESSVYYLLGKGCLQTYEFSDEELRNRISSELKSTKQKRFRKIIQEVKEYKLTDLSTYNSKNPLNEEDAKNKYHAEKCLIAAERMLKILNDLNDLR